MTNLILNLDRRYRMGRAKLPASLQKGNTWSKEQLQQLDALE